LVLKIEVKGQPPASFVSFVGPSGRGKPTLLNLLGCLDKPTRGLLSVAGMNIARLDRKGGVVFRGENLGFIFQDFNLIPVLSVYENIEYSLLMVQNVPAEERAQRVTVLLEAVGTRDQFQTTFTMPASWGSCRS
jgi:putative ABC transport system ATP-binding protein